MNRTTWILLLSFVAFPAISQAQSEISRQLQQKLSNRKATTQSQTTQSKTTQSKTPTESQAPTENPDTLIASLTAKTPKEFSEALHLAVISENLEAFNGLVSWATILKSATSQLEGKPIDEFRKSFLTDVKSRNSLGAKIIQTVKTGGSYEFLQLRKTQQTVVAVFRMLLPGGRGVNYHEYSLAKTRSGKVVASDIYIYLTGEELSRSIRRNLITALAEKDSASGVNLSDTDKLLSQNLETIEKLNEALSKKDPQTARTQILKLPMELRKDKAIQTLTLNTYQNSSSFKTVLEGVRKACPEDVFMDMVAIDVLVRQKKFDEAIIAIERIGKKVGGDPYLKILHGRMLLNQGDEKEGRQLIREAVSEDDGILSGYWNLVSFALKDKDHDETLRLLKKIHLRFRIKFKDLRKIPSYKDFVKSSEFKDWTKYLESAEVSAPTEEPKNSTGTASASNRRTTAKTK